MRITFAASLLALATSAAAMPAKDIQKMSPAERMAYIKAEKIRLDDERTAAGVFDLDRYEAHGPAKCDGSKAGEYSCKAIDMMGFIRHQDMGSKSCKGNDVWGWTSKDGREFGVVCQTDGAAFIEVLKDGSMVYLGRINTASSSALWRDAKIIGDMAYIVADVSKHGMQVFDMKKLLEADPKNPKVYAKEDLVTHFTGFGKAHNIVANEKTNLVFNVGGDGKCNGKLWAFDVKDPANPKDLGCSAGGSYVHDAQCVNYDGPDSKYKGKEVCFDFNVNVLVTVDNSDPTKAVQIGSAKYKGSAYTHQGWVTKGMTHLLLGDEQDEGSNGGNTRTFIFDIKDLANPKHTGTYISKSKAIDHNLYIIDNLAYQSNYATGLRVLDVDSVDKDNTGGGFQEIAYFDVYPEDDNKNPSISYVGSWSNYPYFKSGYILVNSMERGIFSVKMHKSALAHRNGTNVE